MASVEGFLLPLTIRIITDGLTAGDFNSLLMGILLGIGGLYYLVLVDIFIR